MLWILELSVSLSLQWSEMRQHIHRNSRNPLHVSHDETLSIIQTANLTSFLRSLCSLSAFEDFSHVRNGWVRSNIESRKLLSCGTLCMSVLRLLPLILISQETDSSKDVMSGRAQASGTATPADALLTRLQWRKTAVCWNASEVELISACTVRLMVLTVLPVLLGNIVHRLSLSSFSFLLILIFYLILSSFFFSTPPLPLDPPAFFFLLKPLNYWNVELLKDVPGMCFSHFQHFILLN